MNSTKYVGFEVLTAVMRNVAVFWDTALCGPYANHVSVERLIFDPEVGGDTFLRNVGLHMDYTALYFRRWQHSVQQLRSQSLRFISVYKKTLFADVLAHIFLRQSFRWH
jgi:hypothetical protein